MSLKTKHFTRLGLILMGLALIMLVRSVRQPGYVSPPEVIDIETVEVEKEPVLMYSKDGLLIVPYEQYRTFIEAFSYAKETLGDSTTSGSRQWYLWRGGMFHTESERSQ
jgi:hypothetical protein